MNILFSNESSNTDNEFRKKIAYFIFNSVKIIQWAWRTHKLRPKIWIKRVWNIVRNDSISNEKKFLDINLYNKKALDDYKTIKINKKKD